jgi:hypothetical protein
MPVPSWTSAEDWEVLFLGGRRMPGVARVEIQLPSGLEVHKPRGGKKARIKDIGVPPAEIEVELELLPEEMPGLERVIDLLRPRAANGARKPLEIGHPNARLWGIHIIKIRNVGSPQPGPGGSYKLKFAAYEHVDAPKKVKKPADKPESGEPEDWDVQPLIDALRPARQGAAQGNFSSDTENNFSEGEIPGSGF